MESGKRGGKQTGWGGVTRDSQCIDKTKKPFNNVLIVAPRDPHGIHVATGKWGVFASEKNAVVRGPLLCNTIIISTRHEFFLSVAAMVKHHSYRKKGNQAPHKNTVPFPELSLCAYCLCFIWNIFLGLHRDNAGETQQGGESHAGPLKNTGWEKCMRGAGEKNRYLANENG